MSRHFHLFNQYITPQSARRMDVSSTHRKSFNVLSEPFFVDPAYDFVKELGQGAYGWVGHSHEMDGHAWQRGTLVLMKCDLPSVIWSDSSVQQRTLTRETASPSRRSVTETL